MPAPLPSSELHFIYRWRSPTQNWEALCLEYDIMTLGMDFAHAQEMLAEAMELTLADDAEQGFDPNDRRSPPEDWAEFEQIMREGQPTSLAAGAPELNCTPTAIAMIGNTARHLSPRPKPAQRASVPPTAYRESAGVWA